MIREALEGRVALVTGASRGIGRAIALALAEAGVDVAVNYHRNEPEARSVAEQIEATGRRTAVLQANVASNAEVHSMIAEVHKALGPITILVNNAGVSKPISLDKLTEKDWDEAQNVNLKSAFLVTQAVLPDMRAAGWGRIIMLSSVAAQLGGVIGPHYASAKAGMLGLTHSYAALLSKENITVNAIAPALIETDMVTANPNARPDLIPLGRFGKVTEIADVALMLVCNGYLTGQTINVNGGWYMS